MPKRERGKEEELEARKNISGTPAAKEKASASPASSAIGFSKTLTEGRKLPLLLYAASNFRFRRNLGDNNHNKMEGLCAITDGTLFKFELWDKDAEAAQERGLKPGTVFLLDLREGFTQKLDEQYDTLEINAGAQKKIKMKVSKLF